MEILQTELPGVLHIRPRMYGDERGFFMEIFQTCRFRENGLPEIFVQDNLSRSAHGVLRGLHYQIEHPQGKYVTCLEGEIFDVAVDLRRSSPTFGKWTGVTLNSKQRNALYIPPGFGHGFYVRSPSADVFYKCTDLYHPQSERTLSWDDPDVGVDWPLSGEPILSDKDRNGRPLAAAECFP